MNKNNKIIFLTIAISMLTLGCIENQDVTPAVKALPEFQQFMKENPNAKISITYWSKEEVTASSNEINQKCDRNVTPVAMYRAIMTEGELKIIAWINAENNKPLCIISEGKPSNTIVPTTIPTAGQTVVPTTVSRFRVGPTVRIRPINDEIKNGQDGMVELYMDNPSLNDVSLNVDIRINIPSGIHIIGEGFGEISGTVYGTFSVLPGNAKTIYITVKADKNGDFSAQFSGLYWPGDNKDAYQPISLTHPFKVIISPILTSTVTPTVVPTVAPTYNPQLKSHDIHVGPGKLNGNGLNCDTCHGFPLNPVTINSQGGPGEHSVCEQCHAPPPDVFSPSNGNLITIHLSRGKYCTDCHSVASEHQQGKKCELCHTQSQESNSHVNGGKLCLNCHN